MATTQADAASNNSSDKVTNQEKMDEKGVEANAYPTPAYSDEDGRALIDNPFLDPDVAAHWAQVYENCEYESRHLFDPTFTYTAREDRNATWKVDFRVCLWAVC